MTGNRTLNRKEEIRKTCGIFRYTGNSFLGAQIGIDIVIEDVHAGIDLFGKYLPIGMLLIRFSNPQSP